MLYALGLGFLLGCFVSIFAFSFMCDICKGISRHKEKKKTYRGIDNCTNCTTVNKCSRCMP